MTVKAYVLITAHVGKVQEVVKTIRKLEGVTSVDVVTGPYDAIAIIQRETLADIGNLITSMVHPVAGISRTVTCLVM